MKKRTSSLGIGRSKNLFRENQAGKGELQEEAGTKTQAEHKGCVEQSEECHQQPGNR